MTEAEQAAFKQLQQDVEDMKILIALMLEQVPQTFAEIQYVPEGTLDKVN